MNRLAAKVSRPRVPDALVRRQRLIDMLDAGTQRPVTLISAGAGWGKTVLVASWAELGSPPGPVGWLTLDAEDNNPSVFWFHVLSALREAGAIPDEDHVVELAPDVTVNHTLVDRVAQSLARLPGPFVLVFDDLHAVDDPQVMRDLAVLLRYPPERLRMVLTTRGEPALPLHRIRAAGGLTEMHPSDLEFNADEAAELLSRHDLRLSEDDLATLLERTEGWPAGLRLAVTFLTTRGDGHDIDTFAGDVHAVADYLAGEVLANLPRDVYQFLLYTSVPDQLCGELADALTGKAHGHWILEQLERDNAFVIGLGSQPQWFRYHHLLRDALKHQLQLHAPTMLPQLHIRAATWYASQNATLQALHHAAAGQDWRFVGRLAVAQAAPLILSADRTALVKVLARIPREQLAKTAELVLCGALLSFHAADYDTIPAWTSRARQLLNGRAEDDRIAAEVTLRSLELAVRRVRGDMPALISAATEILGWLTKLRFAQLPSAPQFRAIALSNKGVGLLWIGQLDLAERYLWAALTAARAAGIGLVEINALGHLALLAFMRGSLREVYEHATSGRDLARRRGWTRTLQATPAHLAFALLEIERNNLPEAQQALAQGVNSHRADPEAAQWAVLCVARTRLLMAQGDLDAAQTVLRHARQRTDARTVAPVLGRWLLLAESEFDLASDHPQNVKTRYGQPAGDETAHREAMCLARAELALGHPHRAEGVLARSHPGPCDAVGTVEAQIVAALVADAQRHGNRSVDALAEAISVAEREGVRRPFFSVGSQQIAELVARHRLLIRENAGFVADVLAEMKLDGRRSPPVSDLSDRELDVLRYLPTMLNANEIAVELHVSVNTVKAHLRSIYRKLEASRRREAVVRARGLGIL